MKSYTFGIVLDEPCHRTSFTRNIDISSFSDLSQENQESLLWRSRIRSICDSTSICRHYEMMYGLVFK